LRNVTAPNLTATKPIGGLKDALSTQGHRRRRREVDDSRLPLICSKPVKCYCRKPRVGLTISCANC
jgi:hypothetical protein